MNELVRRDAWAGLVERIYSAAIEGDPLNTILECVTSTIQDVPAVIFGADTVNFANNFLLHRGLCTEAVVLHVNNLTVGNPWLAAQWRQPVGAIYQDSDLLKAEELDAWPKAKQWYTMLGQNTRATGMVIHRRNNKQLVVEVRYTPAQETRVRRAITEMFERLGTHFVLAARMQCMRREFPIEAPMSTSLLELSSLPILIIDSDDRVRNLNERARIMASKMETFFISAEQEFHAMDLVSEAAFKTELHALVSGSRRISKVIPFWNSDRSKRVFIALAKLSGGKNEGGCPNQSYPARREQIALIIQDVDEELELTSDTLWTAFRLSNAECDLAVRLLRGQSIGEVACANGVSKQTLRNQLSSIMRKTSTSRQSQLVSLLTKLAVAPLS
ncbi:helix-turn-helix transcriptional regulator [Falsihalocynthiibacter sp. SS001]|uniref:helix-turn-helix transcriptional regulator n=1 Tax=Falsihalocynthiibacter sp. SS001 TaxID=3349698 RepID=UPI0036D2D9D4